MQKGTIIVSSETGIGASPALATAIAAWADSTTDPESRRRSDLIRDKTRAVADFFTWCARPVNQVTPLDVKAWQARLEDRGLAAATVYARVSRVSSFFRWALEDPRLAGVLRSNPVDLARPKAPKAYQTESAQALDDSQARALLELVKQRANCGSIVALRDYAMLLFYLATGMRRQEVVTLAWGDVKTGGVMILTGKVKGGEIVNREVREPAVAAALLNYLEASGRLAEMRPESPLWTRHDRAGSPGAPLTSHAFAKNLKRYARLAGIGAIHLHQTRHTFARIVAEESGSLTETQEALGHRNQNTTRVYVQRIGLKRDRFSSLIARKLEID